MTSISDATVGSTIFEAVRLRGRLLESSNTGAPFESMPQHHHYFGNEHLPPNLDMTYNDSPQLSVENNNENYVGSSEVTDSSLSQFPSISPAQSNEAVASVDSVLKHFLELESKKKMKTKKGSLFSSSPSMTPTMPSGLREMPSIHPKIEPSISNHPVSPPTDSTPSTQLTLPPSPTIEREPESAILNPIFSSSDSLSKEGRAATVVVTTSVIVLVALVLIVAVRRNGKRRRSVSKLNITDPALCGGASISSERSSTFRGDDGKKINDFSQNSSNTSNMNLFKDKTSPLSVTNRRNKNGVAMHVLKLVNTSIEYKKGRDGTNGETESFPTLTPYLVDGLSSLGNERETALSSIIGTSNKSDQAAQPTSLYDVDDVDIDGETLIEASDRLSWRAALDLDFKYNDKLSDNRHPWRSQRYPTAVREQDENPYDPDLALPNETITSARVTVTKKKSMDEMSMGSVDYINPEIVQQFKVVDQRLSEGFEQFRAVDQCLSDGFDKLEATLVKNSHATKSNTDDTDGERSSHASIIIDVENLESSTRATTADSEKPSNEKPATDFSEKEENDCHDDSPNDDDDDDDDDDDFHRRYQFHQLRNHFSSSWYQRPNEEQRHPQQVQNRSPSPAVNDGTVANKMPSESAQLPCYNYEIPANPVSLLTLPKKPHDDSSSSAGNSINSHDVEGDSDDIMSTTDEYSFEKIRSRFNQH